MLKAAVEAKAEGICHPIILGNDEAIEKLSLIHIFTVFFMTTLK